MRMRQTKLHLDTLHGDIDVAFGPFTRFDFTHNVTDGVDRWAFAAGTEACLFNGLRFGIGAADAKIAAAFSRASAALGAKHINFKGAAARHKEPFRPTGIADAVKADHR